MKKLLKLAAAMTLAVGAASAAFAQAKPADPIPLRLAVYPGALLSLPEFIGSAEGIYARNGITPNLVPIPTGPEQIAAAASGSVDVVGNTVGNALLAIAQGQDLVVVANNLNGSLYTWLKQPAFGTPNLKNAYPAPVRDFKGARIGISIRGSEVELFTRVLLADAGLDPNKDVTWIPVGFGQPALAAFEAKQVDILVTMEPVQSVLLSRNVAQAVLDIRQGGGPDLFKNFPGQSRIARRATTVEKSEAMRRYVKAQSEIIRFIGDEKNAEVVAGHYAKAAGLDVALARKITLGYRTAFSTRFDCTGYAKVLTYLERSGQMTADQVKKAPACERLIAPVAQAAS